MSEEWWPEDRPVLYLRFKLSTAGRQDAFRQGVVAGWEESRVVTPKDADWERAVALGPELAADGESGELTIGRRADPTVINEEPTELWVYDGGTVRPFAVWSKPAVTLGEPRVEPLDSYPTLSELLSKEESLRASTDARVSELDEFVQSELVPKWRKWVLGSFRQAAREICERWLASEACQRWTTLNFPEEPPVELTRLKDAVEADPCVAERIVTAFEAAADVFEDVQAKFDAYVKERDELQAARAWVQEFGSTRLKKAAALGLLGNSLSVYRDERLALEHPGWKWLDNSLRVKRVINPNEHALDLLAVARKFDGNASLAWIETPEYRGTVVQAQFLKRRIYRHTDAPTGPRFDNEEPF